MSKNNPVTILVTLTTLLLVSACAPKAEPQMNPQADVSQTPAPAKQLTLNRAVFGAGAVALFTCSGHFVAGRTLEQLKSSELADADGVPLEFIAFPWDPIINVKDQFVSMETGQGKMIAVHREGLGCSILPLGSTVADRDNMLGLSRARSTLDTADLLSLNLQNKTTAEQANEISPTLQTQISKIVDNAYDTEIYNPNTRSLGIVVVKDGKIIAERYRQGFGPKVQYRSWSSAKSMTSTLIGAAIQKGLISDVNERVAIAEWPENDPRSDISLDNLLRMSSGLQTENPEQGNQSFAAYFGGANSAELAASQDIIAEPGERYHYSNYDTLLLLRHLQAVLPSKQAYLDFPYESLFDRIGMLDTIAETDAYGNYVMSSQVYTTPRDLAKLGMLYLNDGVINGERILPPGWVEYSCRQTVTREDGRYAAHWWLADPSVFYPDQKLTPVCTANGARGQIVAFFPEYNAVVARMGIDSLMNSEWFFNEDKFLADVTFALSQEAARGD